MTKEAIFDKIVGSYFRKLSPQTIKDIDKAMEEYARQQAIAFNMFVETNYTGNCRFGYYTSKDETRLSVEDVYNQFIEQQNKQ